MPARFRLEVACFAELLGISVVGVAQPVLDVFGNAPEQFAFRGASTRDILVFAILVALIPAAVLWLPGALARLASDRAGRVVHHSAIAVALFIGLLQVLHVVGVGGIAKAGLAAAGAAAGVWLFSRFAGVRLWTRIMSLFSVVVIGLFLFSSPTGELALAEPPDTVELVVDDNAAPDIVMIVLDEVPTALLLDESGGIDALRYPAHAEFAADATWFRRYTTVSAETVRSVPAMLSGQLPSETSGPTWTQQPDNLFRLLGGAYHLAASEALTRLCPQAWCGRSPIAPPPETAAADPPAAAMTTTPPDGAGRGGLDRLLDDAFDLWKSQISLDRDDQPVYAGLAETAVDDVPEPARREDAIEAIEVPDRDAGDVEEFEGEGALAAFLATESRAVQIPRVEAFRATITPSPRPTLYFVHLVLPHTPFVFTETGATYAGPSHLDATSADWDEVILAERMSLQMQFADRLVGDILDDLRDAGMYDDALVVIAGDHGASLDRSKQYRYYDGTNASELMVTPLFVKTPRQPVGTVSDAPIESVDLLPTLADLLGIDVPWTMDGESVLDRDPTHVDPGCIETLRHVRFGRDILADQDDAEVELFTLCPTDVVPGGLVPILADVRPTDDWAISNLARHSPYAELLGDSWDSLATTLGDATLTLESADLHDGSSPPVGVVDGAVDGAGADWVAVALDGRIAGISPLYDRSPSDDSDRADHFTILVPSPLLDENGYDVRVATLETIDGDLVATELISGARPA